MTNARRILVIFVIAILFTVFVNVSIEAIYPSPENEDYCIEERKHPHIPAQAETEKFSCPELIIPEELESSCQEQQGEIDYKYDNKDCPITAYCETCHKALDNAQEKYNLIVFLVSAVLGLIALIVGLNLPVKKNQVHEWVGSGFLLGGLITVFTGTVRYFGDMGRYIRPIIIFLELVLVIYLAYKKLGKVKKK